MTEDFLEQIKWNSEGLVPVITQDNVSKRILTQAWLNREALQAAVSENRAVYWSRSRQSLWRKGEQSGNVQELVDVYLDCDNDSVCYLVKQIGGVACHTGRESCFYQRLVDGEWQAVDPVIRDPKQMYGGS
ncbi:MAG: phosphoribosyl-AMP cyclohydrolase [Gammaproteobacteria bacterium]|nr:phosphoribosyl-AMP cyclohydrolase [Gammaproteobacteria bacterium]